MQKTLAQFPFLRSVVKEALIIKKKTLIKRIRYKIYCFYWHGHFCYFTKNLPPPPPQDTKINTPFPYNVAR